MRRTKHQVQCSQVRMRGNGLTRDFNALRRPLHATARLSATLRVGSILVDPAGVSRRHAATARFMAQLVHLVINNLRRGLVLLSYRNRAVAWRRRTSRCSCRGPASARHPLHLVTAKPRRAATSACGTGRATERQLRWADIAHVVLHAFGFEHGAGISGPKRDGLLFVASERAAAARTGCACSPIGHG